MFTRFLICTKSQYKIICMKTGFYTVKKEENLFVFKYGKSTSKRTIHVCERTVHTTFPSIFILGWEMSSTINL